MYILVSLERKISLKKSKIENPQQPFQSPHSIKLCGLLFFIDRFFIPNSLS